MPGESGAPALDFENYKKFYGFGIPKWSPYYFVTEEDDKANADTLARFNNEGGGALPTFQTHEDLRAHLLEMSDTELNRMRDFGCGKPHWSPYYVEAAYQKEAGVIDGDSQSMKYTKVRDSTPRSARSLGSKAPSETGSRRGSRCGSRSGSAGVPELQMAKPMDVTQYGGDSARSNQSSLRSNRSELLKAAQASARSTARSTSRSSASETESKRIQHLLATKEREIQELREQLAMTRGK